ncbi:MAG: pilus assembly protein PilM [Pirellulales bacterium]
MAKTGAVWGIDIGHCALKALRCGPHEDDPTRITALAFEYIEYSKILSQPEADPDELVAEALDTFLSRNVIAGDRVAISVSGQSGLARFIKLPPVESKKIPDIVKYEAKQQIPFALEDVVWDYQQMAGGSVEEGFALETEVGLFAMKRDQVYRALKPLTDHAIGVDVVQLTPLSIYNYVTFDRLHDLPPADEYDPEDPPPSLVVISLGTDTTDLVVTNGYRVWQRSVPIGGSHFTKALSKELRLTFSKAEHLKRNVTKAENPKALFKAMRPVFSDLVTEIQRSIGYFTGLDRTAKIGGVVAMGNAFKLPGLRRYLEDNLKQPVEAVKSLQQVDGAAVTSDPKFKTNLLSFCVSYGLCLQGLGLGKISTNLVPQEIVTERLIREKKPWAVAAVAALLVGGTINYFGHVSAYQSVDVERDDFRSALGKAKRIYSEHNDVETAYQAARSTFEKVDAIGKSLISNVEGRLMWLELLKAVDAALPSDPPEKKQAKIADRNELHIVSLDCEKMEDLSTWFDEDMSKIYVDDYRAIFPPAAGGEDDGSKTAGGQEATVEGPTDAGWVIELRGYHYHNDSSPTNQGANFVRNTLIKNLIDGKVMLPVEENGELKEVPIKDLGIAFPVLVETTRISEPMPLVDPNRADALRRAAAGEDREGSVARRKEKPEEEEDAAPAMQMVKRFNFIVQFCWQPTPPSVRKEIANKRAEEDKAKAAALAAQKNGGGGE